MSNRYCCNTNWNYGTNLIFLKLKIVNIERKKNAGIYIKLIFKTNWLIIKGPIYNSLLIALRKILERETILIYGKFEKDYE